MSRTSARDGDVTFVFSLATQFENLGDCLINDLLLRELARRGRVVVLAQRAPAWLLDRLAEFSSIIICRAWPRFLREILSSSKHVFVFKPGHCVARPRLACLARLAAVTTAARILRVCGWKFVRAGVSLDEYQKAEAFLQGALGRQHALYGLRDQKSVAKAQLLGIPAPEYTPDLAFLLPLRSTTRGLTRRSLAVSLRQRQWMGDDGKNILGPLAAIAGKLKADGWSIRVVQQVTLDEKLSESVMQRLGCSWASFAQTETSASAVLDAYADSAIVVSNRLHALLFGWACGAIPIAIVDPQHDSKIAGLFQQVGLQELILDCSHFGSLNERVQALTDCELEWQGRLRSVFLEQQAMLSRVFSQKTVRS